MAIQEASVPNASSKESSPQKIARDIVSSVLKQVPHPIHRKQYAQTFLESQCTSFFTQKQAEGADLDTFLKKTAKHLIINSLNMRRGKTTKLWKRGLQKRPNFVDFPADQSSPAQRVIRLRGGRLRDEDKMVVGTMGHMRIASGRTGSSGNAAQRDKTMGIAEPSGGTAGRAPLATRGIEQYDPALQGIEPGVDSSAKKEEAHVLAMAELSVQNRGLKRTCGDRAVEAVRDVKRLRSHVFEAATMF